MSMSLSVPPLVVISGSTGEGATPFILMPPVIPLNFDSELSYAGHNPIGWLMRGATDVIDSLYAQCELSPAGVTWPIGDFVSMTGLVELDFLKGLVGGASINLSTMQIGSAAGQQRLCIIVNLGHVSDENLGKATADGIFVRCLTQTGLAFDEAVLLRRPVDEVLLGHRLAHYLLRVPCSTLAVTPGFKDIPHGFIVAATSNLDKARELMTALKQLHKPVFYLRTLAEILDLSPDFFDDTPVDRVGNCPLFFGDPQHRSRCLADRVLSILNLVSLMRPDLAKRMLVVGDTACLVVKGEDGPNGLPVNHTVITAAGRIVGGIPSVCTSQELVDGIFSVPEVSGGRHARTLGGFGYDPFVRVVGAHGEIALDWAKRHGRMGKDPHPADLRHAAARLLGINL